jgi:predicted metal-dependent phosphoesterase TrpH
LSRRNLAAVLVRTNQAGSIREAFHRYLSDHGKVALPKRRLPAAEAIRLVRDAGGVVSWAHPWENETRAAVQALHAAGLQAVEAEYPGFKPAHARQLRELAVTFGLAITGGSDCHGPGQPRRAIGTTSITAEQLEALRRLRTT